MAQLEDEEEEDVRKSQGDERKQEAQGDGKDTAEENTLEKYMKMVLEARAEQQEKVPPLKSPTLSDTPSPSVSPCVFFFFFRNPSEKRLTGAPRPGLCLRRKTTGNEGLWTPWERVDCKCESQPSASTILIHWREI